MGHTIYYKTDVRMWEQFSGFLERISNGLGYTLTVTETSATLEPDNPRVEPLIIEKKGFGFAKTNLIEPHHSIYLLVLHSVAFFGSVELWED